MTARWQSEREAIAQVQGLKEQIDQVRVEIEQAERAVQPGEGGRTALWQNAEAGKRAERRPSERVRQLQAKGALLKEEVDSEEIAAVVSKWTGVPVSKLLEGEREKLIRMEGYLHAARRGAGGGGERRLGRHSPQPGGAAGPQPAQSARLSSWDRPA